MGRALGRRALTEPGSQSSAPTADLATLARGGRINFFGFVLRLAARLPFLFIAGRMYGADALGRFAYAILVVEFAAQLATLGLKRGLAQQLAHTDKPHACVAWDSLLVALIGSTVTMAILLLFPEAMYPNSKIEGLDRLLAITVIALAWSDIMLAALAYRHDIGATVRARAIVEPWTISIAAFVLAFVDKRDGLIIAYVLSMVGALAASIVPFLKSYGVPREWRPEPGALWAMARKNLPVAAADAVEWASRRVDLAVLGVFMSAEVVGIYYVAQQVASLPSKLKNSFDPILGPVIAQNVRAGNKEAVARQVRQVGFWVIAAQTGVALALAIPGEAVMGLVGPNFVSGTAALSFLLAAEVVASMAAVSEAALIYISSHRNMWISLVMIALEAGLSAGLILLMRNMDLAIMWQATGPAIALLLSLGFAAIAKSQLLRHLLKARVSGWRWPLIWAAGAGVVAGEIAIRLPEWAELIFGIPMIMIAFGTVLWIKGFGPQDRELFRMSKKDIADLSLPDPSTGGDAPR
jgi:O-antigen/teichoic acid export membrane protein